LRGHRGPRCGAPAAEGHGARILAKVRERAYTRPPTARRSSSLKGGRLLRKTRSSSRRSRSRSAQGLRRFDAAHGRDRMIRPLGRRSWPRFPSAPRRSCRRARESAAGREPFGCREDAAYLTGPRDLRAARSTGEPATRSCAAGPVRLERRGSASLFCRLHVRCSTNVTSERIPHGAVCVVRASARRPWLAVVDDWREAPLRPRAEGDVGVPRES